MSSLDAVLEQPAVDAVTSWLSSHKEDILKDLKTYVELETPSDNRGSLEGGLNWLRTWLRRRLGPEAEHQSFPGNQYGDTEVFVYPSLDKTVTLLAHYDTVWPLGTLAEIPFSVTGDVIRGPGVFDMKAGLVQAVWGVQAARQAGLPLPTIRLLLNGDEEIGSPASRPVIEQICSGSAAVLVFESSADGGALKSARKGVGIFDVHVSGVAAHAGLDPTKGVSAVDGLARVVTELHSLTDLDAGTTVNVGVVTGGTRRNVIAGSATGQIDVRVSNTAEMQRIDRALQALPELHDRAEIRVTGDWNRPPMERTPAVKQVVTLAQQLAEKLGFTLGEASVGGASDGNFAAAMGLPVLDGFGAVGAGAHARTEHATVSGVVERAALAALVFSALATETIDTNGA